MSKTVNKLYKHNTTIYKVILFLITTVAIVYLFPKGGQFKYEFTKGKPWQYDNLYAPFDFAINKSEEEITEEIKTIEVAAKLYFQFNKETVSEVKKAYQLRTSLYNVSDSLSKIDIESMVLTGNTIIDNVYNNGFIEAVCITFMLLSAFSFTLHYFAFYMKKPLKYFHDPELKFFISILLVIFTISMAVNMLSTTGEASIRELLFHTVSIVTTTGFAIGDSSQWNPSIGFLLLIGAFIGACSGSVGGGIKSWRVLIMINYAYINLKKMIHPNAVISLKIGNKNVENDVASSVWGFFSIYVISFVILLLGLVMTGLDFESAFSAIGACLNNLGPGLGEVSQTYESVSPAGKGILSFAMILGRLEIFTLLVLFTPVFWRG